MLPAPCRWIESDDAHRLYWNAGWIATAYPDGRLTLNWWSEIHGRAASQAQARRFIERWIAARKGPPPGKRAKAMRKGLKGRGTKRPPA